MKTVPLETKSLKKKLQTQLFKLFDERLRIYRKNALLTSAKCVVLHYDVGEELFLLTEEGYF